MTDIMTIDGFVGPTVEGMKDQKCEFGEANMNTTKLAALHDKTLCRNLQQGCRSLPALRAIPASGVAEAGTHGHDVEALADNILDGHLRPYLGGALFGIMLKSDESLSGGREAL